MSHNALANVIAGRSAVSAEMALRIGTYFGNGAQLWLNLQQDYDLWHAERAIAGELGKIERVSDAAWGGVSFLNGFGRLPHRLRSGHGSMGDAGDRHVRRS